MIDEIYFNKKRDDFGASQFFELIYNRLKILLINTKLASLNSKNRLEQVNEVLKKIEKLPSYDLVVLCGDFNAISAYPEIINIKKRGFRTINKENTHKDKVILDYIFYKTKEKVKVESKVLLKDFSEHYCLINIFKFD